MGQQINSQSSKKGILKSCAANLASTGDPVRNGSALLVIDEISHDSGKLTYKKMCECPKHSLSRPNNQGKSSKDFAAEGTLLTVGESSMAKLEPLVARCGPNVQFWVMSKGSLLPHKLDGPGPLLSWPEAKG